jgi:hypothetical protein
VTDEIDWLGLANKHHAARQPGARRRRPSTPGSPLRAARDNGHRVFDVIWKRGYMSRAEAYRWLAREMGMPADDCHFGMMTAAECKRAEGLAQAFVEARYAETAKRRRDRVARRAEARLAKKIERGG